MGTGKGPRTGFGSVASAETVLHDYGTPILRRALEYGVVTIAGVAFAKFAAVIVVGYAAYRAIVKVRDLKTEYDEMEGSAKQKLGRLAITEGLKIIVNEIIGIGLDRPTNETIDRAIHTTADIMSSEGVFEEITKRADLPNEYADDLRYFFTTTSARTLKRAYAGAKDKVTDYVVREVA